MRQRSLFGPVFDKFGTNSYTHVTLIMYDHNSRHRHVRLDLTEIDTPVPPELLITRHIYYL